jgi:hypothetical protein
LISSGLTFSLLYRGWRDNLFIRHRKVLRGNEGYQWWFLGGGIGALRLASTKLKQAAPSFAAGATELFYSDSGERRVLVRAAIVSG